MRTFLKDLSVSSPLWRCLCRRETEEKEKRKRAGNDPIVPRALAIFRLLLFLLGYPAGASVEERESLCEYLFFNLSKTLVS